MSEAFKANTGGEKFIINTDQQITFMNPKPNFVITFSRVDGGEIGRLDFNGPEMVFTGNAEESAKIFFNYIAGQFRERLEQERAAAREGA